MFLNLIQAQLNMQNMFQDCYNLEYLDLSNFNTEQVLDMNRMFESNNELARIDFGEHFKTSNVKDMQQMFHQCRSLSSLDLRNFDTKSVTNMAYMFEECESLKRLDVTSFRTDKVFSKVVNH